ncbi:MAG: hypothetical protein U5P10_07145 [Spirochaetia bacterium]|nr:hypothetical protein [Spirochaetia bacterium]
MKDSATSRLLAIAYDKGLFLTPEQMKRLQLLVFGGEYGRREGTPAQQEQQDAGHGHEQPQGRQGRHRQGQSSDQRQGNNSENRTAQSQNQSSVRRTEQLQKLIEQDLHRQITRRGSGASLLHLFNHIQANHKNWIIIPLSFKATQSAEEPPEEHPGFCVYSLTLKDDRSSLPSPLCCTGNLSPLHGILPVK